MVTDKDQAREPPVLLLNWAQPQKVPQGHYIWYLPPARQRVELGRNDEVDDVSDCGGKKSTEL